MGRASPSKRVVPLSQPTSNSTTSLQPVESVTTLACSPKSLSVFDHLASPRWDSQTPTASAFSRTATSTNSSKVSTRNARSMDTRTRLSSAPRRNPKSVPLLARVAQLQRNLKPRRPPFTPTRSHTYLSVFHTPLSLSIVPVL